MRERKRKSQQNDCGTQDANILESKQPGNSSANAVRTLAIF